MKKFQSADKGGRKGRLSLPIGHHTQHKKVVLPKERIHFYDPKTTMSRNLFSAKDNKSHDYHFKESNTKKTNQKQGFKPVITDPARRHSYLPVIPHFNE